MAQRAKTAAAIKRKRLDDMQEQSHASMDKDARKLLDEAGLSRELGFVMRMAQLALFEDLIERLSYLKLSLSQFSVLRLILAHPGLIQQRIGDALRIKKANLVALIDNLEGRGLVYRARSTADRRAYALFLTAKGGRIMAKAMDAVGEHLRSSTEVLSTNELDSMLKSLWKVVQSIPYAQKNDAT